MTVPNEISRAGYVGNGVTTVFPYPFLIFANSDLRVTRTTSAGIETVLAINTDYTITGATNPAGGNVTLTVALPGDGSDANSSRLTIRRVLPQTQTMDLRNQGPIYAEVLESAHDRAVMLIQQRSDENARSLRLPESESPSELLMVLPPLAQRKGRGLAFDATTGQPSVVQPTTAVVSGAMVPVVAAITKDSARSILGTTAESISMSLIFG